MQVVLTSHMSHDIKSISIRLEFIGDQALELMNLQPPEIN